MRDLVSFLQLKKREKHPWRSDPSSKVADRSLQLYYQHNSSMAIFDALKIVQVVPKRVKHHIYV